MATWPETGFLTQIGADPDSDDPRLVLADWYEERGDVRGEFIRVQCALLKDPESEDRESLRLRERDLLDEHYRVWIDALSLPLDDVMFRRGTLAKARIHAWDKGAILAAVRAGVFAAVEELDLSDLNLGDTELTEFIQAAAFPSLRHLILSGNDITETSAITLADTSHFPRLETLYIFDNPVARDAEVLFSASSLPALWEVDSGAEREGYSMSPGQADLERRRFIRSELAPFGSQVLKRGDLLRTASLIVAQYWNDNAHDAVHGRLVVSERLEPVIVGPFFDDEPDLNLKHSKPQRISRYRSSVIPIWDDVAWADNLGAITLWAAFASEGGHQEYDEYADVYSPAVYLYRYGGYEILPRQRPFLDGIRPEWDDFA